MTANLNLFPARHPNNTSAVPPIALRCPNPGCRQLGTFESLGQGDVQLSGELVTVGHRRCPNPACKTHVFVAYNSNVPDEVVASYPPERIDFDASDVPAKVVGALEEAITCRANNCFAAAAMMVRKTLEELCADQDAKGDNLRDRLKTLSEKVVLPADLFDGLDHLRLLGNDAAHIESRAYESVGEAEVDAGVAVAKEVIKSVYQMAALVDQLRALRREVEPEPT